MPDGAMPLTDATPIPPTEKTEEAGKPLLDSFTVGAFRGLRDLTLENLGRINLLVGQNNSGKTSVLEALAIYARPDDLGNWINVARSREAGTGAPQTDGMLISVGRFIDAMMWMFPSVENGQIDEAGNHQEIILSATGGFSHQNLTVTCDALRGVPPHADEDGRELRRFPRESEDDFGLIISINQEDEDKKVLSSKEFQIWSSVAYRQPRRKAILSPLIELMAPYSHRSESHQLVLASKAIEDEFKDDVVALLRSIDRNISEMVIVTSGDGRRPILKLRHHSAGYIPVSVLGDGVRRALSIALAIPRARNGLLLIDEIESALHISVLDTLYPWLERACEKYNVQVFATTHSLEAIDAIAKIDQADSRSLAAYHLGVGEEETRRYTGGMLRRLVHERGLDIR